jgi:hypothetical protein
MDYKKTNAPASTITRDTNDLAEKVGNIYETLSIISKRANQIGADMKTELNQKISEFASYTDNLEEVFENREQIPKPTLLATQEYLEGETYFRNPAKEEVNKSEF